MNQVTHNASQESEGFETGASLYRRFLLMPEKYKGKTALLRVLMKGKFSGWRLRASLINAFGFEDGNVLFMNNVVALGIDTSDIEDSVLDVDCIAEGEAAEWILDQNITTGTVFEGEFEFGYELVKGVVGVKGSPRSEDAKIAMLVLKKGIAVIEQRKSNVETEVSSERELVESLRSLFNQSINGLMK